MVHNINTHLYKYFEQKKLFNNQQNGFRSRKNTANVIGQQVKQVQSIIEGKGFAQATLCDLSKSF